MMVMISHCLHLITLTERLIEPSNWIMEMPMIMVIMMLMIRIMLRFVRNGADHEIDASPMFILYHP